MDFFVKRLFRVIGSQVYGFAKNVYDNLFEDSNSEQQTKGSKNNGSYHNFNDNYKSKQNKYDKTRNAGASKKAKKKNRIDFYYSVLGVSPNSDTDEIKKAFREKISRYHPDRFESDPEKKKIAEEVTLKLNEAYDAILELRKSK